MLTCDGMDSVTQQTSKDIAAVTQRITPSPSASTTTTPQQLDESNIT